MDDVTSLPGAGNDREPLSIQQLRPDLNEDLYRVTLRSHKGEDVGVAFLRRADLERIRAVVTSLPGAGGGHTADVTVSEVRLWLVGSTPQRIKDALARLEAAANRTAEAEYQQRVHKTFGEEQFARAEAAGAERDAALADAEVQHRLHEASVKDRVRLRNALKRLTTMEAFTGVAVDLRFADSDILKRELNARQEFARAVLGGPE